SHGALAPPRAVERAGGGPADLPAAAPARQHPRSPRPPRGRPHLRALSRLAPPLGGPPLPLPRPHRQGWHTRGGRRQRSPSLPRQHLEFLHPLPRHALRPPRRRLTHRPLQPRRQFTEDHILETLACTFDNLKSLTLWTHFEEMPTILSTFCMLRNAPNLEELDIMQMGSFRMQNGPTACVPTFKLCD
uniref:FBD domain-containing protein n=1 Tax=Aegilops tauschii subsp. strangulata TaxID=200361 RepID=A0A453KTJ6_AEGTS